MTDQSCCTHTKCDELSNLRGFLERLSNCSWKMTDRACPFWLDNSTSSLTFFKASTFLFLFTSKQEVSQSSQKLRTDLIHVSDTLHMNGELLACSAKRHRRISFPSGYHKGTEICKFWITGRMSHIQLKILRYVTSFKVSTIEVSTIDSAHLFLHIRSISA